MGKRKDAHRPSAINPDDYAFVACDYLGGGVESMMFVGEREAFRAHMQATGGKFAEHHNSGSCHICGARALYVARFHHLPENRYIMTGMDCADKMGMGDPVAFASFKKRVAAGLKLKRGKTLAGKLLDEANLGHAWELFVKLEEQARADGWDALRRDEQTLVDVIRDVVKYGNLSEGRAKFVATLMQRIAERPMIEAQRKAEADAAAPVPQTDKRVKVVGKVLTTKQTEGAYGPVTKMLVRHETGYKLWGTVPSELSGIEGGLKDKTVEFTARIERSKDDEKFGFFSRPTKAAILTEVSK